jgi:hypothetical protein
MRDPTGTFTFVRFLRGLFQHTTLESLDPKTELAVCPIRAATCTIAVQWTRSIYAMVSGNGVPTVRTVVIHLVAVIPISHGSRPYLMIRTGSGILNATRTLAVIDLDDGGFGSRCVDGMFRSGNTGPAMTHNTLAVFV